MFIELYLWLSHLSNISATPHSLQLEVFCNSKLRNYLRKSEGEAPPTLEEVEDTGEFTDPNVKLMINAGIPPSW